MTTARRIRSLVAPSWQDAAERRNRICLAGLAVLLVGIAYFVLVFPNRSYTTIWLNDEMALTAAVYRVYGGQIPSVDFHSVYGFFSYLPAALGFALGINPGAVLAFGEFVVAVFLLFAAVLLCYPRFQLWPSLVLIVFLGLFIIAPAKMGGSPFDSTLAMYYDRNGWAGLAILLLCYVEPRKPSAASMARDAAIEALLLLFLVYSAINFGAVGAGFLVANAIVSAYNRKVSLISLGCVLAAIATLEIFTHYNSAYVHDIGDTARNTPFYLTAILNIAKPIHGNETILTACLLSVVALFRGGRRRFFDLAFFAGAVVVGLLLTTQTGAPGRGIPLLVSVFMCFAELARRENPDVGRYWPPQAASLSIFGLMLVFVAELSMINAVVLYEYHRNTAGRAASAKPELPQRLAGFLVAPASWPTVQARGVITRNAGEPRRALDGVLVDEDYLSTIAEGAAFLERSIRQDQAIVVLDHADPFTFGLGLRLTPYGYPIFYPGVDFRTNHPPPELFFSGADYVVIPDAPYTPEALEVTLDVYGTYIRANFSEVARSRYWHLWQRMPAAAAMPRPPHV